MVSATEELLLPLMTPAPLLWLFAALSLEVGEDLSVEGICSDGISS